MSQRYLVQIDFPALLENLRDADTSQDWDLDAVRGRLAAEGFAERDDGWECDEMALARLDRSEVLSQERL